MDNDNWRWKLRDDASSHRVVDLLVCIADIMDAFDTVRDETTSRHAMNLVLVARRVSVALRKILLDGNGSLLKSCLAEPRLHPLKAPAADTLSVEFVEKHKSVTVTALFEKEGKETTFVAPDSEHRTRIDPLHGIRHDEEGIFAIESPFDLNACPIKFKSWMSRRVVQVDDAVFTSRDLLRLIANKEGAHLSPGFRMVLPDRSSLAMNSKDSRYEAVNAIKFGGLSYAQIYCMFTSLYVVERSKELMDEVPKEEGDAIPGICDRIGEYRTGFLARGSFGNESCRIFVLGGDLELDGASIGDLYSTTVRIP